MIINVIQNNVIKFIKYIKLFIIIINNLYVNNKKIKIIKVIHKKIISKLQILKINLVNQEKIINNKIARICFYFLKILISSKKIQIAQILRHKNLKFNNPIRQLLRLEIVNTVAIIILINPFITITQSVHQD